MLKFAEKILLQQIKSGNQAAFGRLYDQYQDKIYRFIYFRVSSETLAQDLTSEVFIKVLNYLKSGGEIESFQSFVYRTAKNLIIDFYRQRGQSDVPIDEFLEANIPAEKDLLQQTEQKFELEKIQQAVAELAEVYREVIVLKFIEDLPFKEIAKILDITETNARMIAHRGMKMLRQKLANSSQK